MAGLVWLSNIHVNSVIHIIKVKKRRSMWGARFKTMVYFISYLMVIHILSCAFHYNLKCLLDFLSQLLWAFIIMKIKLCIDWYYSTVQINFISLNRCHNFHRLCLFYSLFFKISWIQLFIFKTLYLVNWQRGVPSLKMKLHDHLSW